MNAFNSFKPWDLSEYEAAACKEIGKDSDIYDPFLSDRSGVKIIPQSIYKELSSTPDFSVITPTILYKQPISYVGEVVFRSHLGFASGVHGFIFGVVLYLQWWISIVGSFLQI